MFSEANLINMTELILDCEFHLHEIIGSPTHCVAFILQFICSALNMKLLKMFT